MPSEATNQFPVQTGHWLRGSFRQMQRDPLGLYTQMQRQHGDYVRMRVVRGIDCYVLTHPDAVEHVLHKAHKNYRKPDIFNNSVSLLVGNGLFTNEGESWLHQRRLVQPMFHSTYLATLCNDIVQSTQDFVDQPKNGPIDICDAMMKLGLRIASTTAFGTDISSDQDAIGKAFRVTFKHISDRMNSMQLIPHWLPTPANRSFKNAKKKLDDVVMNLITTRRNTGTHLADDFLGVLLNARDEITGQPMPDRLLMDEVLTLLTAGHENVGAALAWSWFLLAKHPHIQSDLHDEIYSRLQGRLPTFEDVQHLPLLSAVFQESMRLYPPGWGELRESISADQIAGYPIPPKSMIILCQWVTHRHPDFWDDPDTFKPARFLSPQSKTHHRFAYFPFGGGPRICIGMQLAMLEGALVIATILQQFRVELVEEQTVVPDATFTLRPKYGVKVLLYSRD